MFAFVVVRTLLLLLLLCRTHFEQIIWKCVILVSCFFVLAPTFTTCVYMHLCKHYDLHYTLSPSTHYQLILQSLSRLTKMYPIIIWIVIVIGSEVNAVLEFYETDVNFRVDAGSKTCFFEKGEAGQTMELFYQVLDGQHGDLDITVVVTDPTGAKLVSDYKKSQNSIIMELAHDGDYAFCLDNTHSIMNSKLVFVYVVIEDRLGHEEETVVSEDEDGEEHAAEEILEWIGTDEEGNNYTIAVTVIIESMKRILGHVVHARHMLDKYAATKSRDSYSALEDTFIVDVWSAFQIVFMICVGMLQVYMIKKLFDSPCSNAKY